jgi:hypothetical protein
MGTQNKWSGSLGKVGASGGSSVSGGNVYHTPETSPANKSSSSVKDNIINCKTGPGDNMGTSKISSHNDINAFTRGIKSRGPYGGPQFSSFNTSKQNMQRSDTSSISKFNNPSMGSTSRGSAGGSGTGMTKNSKVGSGQAKGERQSSPKGSNKDGSGYMAAVRGSK